MQDRFQALVNNLPYGFARHRVVVNQEGVPVDYEFLEVNPAFEKLTGLEKSEALGYTITQVLPDIRGFHFDWIEVYSQVVNTGESLQWEAYSDPLERWYEVTAFSDEPGYLVTIFHDITFLKKESEKSKKLMEYGRRCQEMDLSSLDYNFFADTVREVSGAEFVILNLISQDDETKTVTRAVSGPPAWRSWINEELGLSIQGSSWETEHQKLQVAGRNRLVYFPSFAELGYYRYQHIAPLLKRLEEELQPGGVYVMELNFAGVPLGTITIVMPPGKDLDHQEQLELYINQIAATIKRLRIEQDLWESQELFNQVLNATEDGIWEWNVKTEEAYFSDHYYTMLGYSPGEFSPSYQSWRSLLHPEDEGEVEDKLSKIFQGEEGSFDIIFRARTKGGEHKWINGRGKVVTRDEEGLPARVVGSHIDINERIEQEERYRSIINAARTVSLVVTDLDSIVQEFSPGAETIFGYTREEMLGCHVAPLHSSSEVEKFPSYIEKLKQDKEGFTVETEMVRKSGEHFPALFTLEPLLDIEGEVGGTLGVTVDISAQKEVEEKLRRSEEKFRAYTEKAPLAIFVSNNRGQFLEVNQEACRLTGYNEAELLSISVPEFLAPEFLDEGLESFEQLKISQHLETNILGRKKNGKRFWANLVATRLDDEQLIGFCRDITEQIEAEEALRQSEERFRFLVENASEGILVAQDGLVKYVNSEVARIIGYSKEEMLETPFGEYIHPQDRERVMERHWKRLQGEAVEERYEFRVVRKDQDVRWVEISAGPVEWEKRSATLNLIMDITERKQAEEKIRYLSFHDTLTGLYNRAYMEEEMNRLDTARQLPIGIIMVDLNGLKLINDTYGHQKGDELLLKAAKIITGSCRKEDLIARWGGDEFVILLPGTGKSELELISQRIEENSRGVSVEGIPVSLALGSEVKETPGHSLEEVLKKAENHMYQHKFAESRRVKNNVLSSLLQSLSAKSFETEMHTHYMLMVAWEIGEELGLSSSELNRLSQVITLHDVGKVGIPEKTLTKEDPLTEEEWETMKAHPEIGYRIVLATEDFAHTAEEILFHHEWWDGRGYPRGTKGSEIPLLARITAVADAYEVMTSGRPYQEPRTHQEALEELKRGAGTQFDPEVVEILVRKWEQE